MNYKYTKQKQLPRSRGSENGKLPNSNKGHNSIIFTDFARKLIFLHISPPTGIRNTLLKIFKGAPYNFLHRRQRNAPIPPRFEAHLLSLEKKTQNFQFICHFSKRNEVTDSIVYPAHVHRLIFCFKKAGSFGKKIEFFTTCEKHETFNQNLTDHFAYVLQGDSI